MKCEKCNSEMLEIDRETVMDDVDLMDEDLTEGKMADFFAEQESGEYFNYGYTEITYKCKSCGSELTIDEV